MQSLKGLTAGPVEVVIRTPDIYATAAYLAVFGQQPRWARELSPAGASAVFGLPASITPQLVVDRPGCRSAVRLVEGMAPALAEFTVGGAGIDFYTSDVELTARLAAVRGDVPEPPLTWKEEGQVLIEARAVEPGGTFSVYTPQMHAESRLHPSSFDTSDGLLHSELVMTSWFIDRRHREAERQFWTEVLNLEVILDTVMDAEDMQVLNGLSRAEPMSSLQLAQDGYPCVVDLLSYPEIDLPDRDPNAGALVAIVVELAADDLRRLSLLPGAVTWHDDDNQVGGGDIVVIYSPSGIRVVARAVAATASVR